MTYPINWDLEPIFPGGIDSPQLQARIHEVAAEIPPLLIRLQAWDFAADADGAAFGEMLAQLQDIDDGLSTTGSFANMIQSADIANEQAGVVKNQVQTVATQAEAVATALQKKLVALSAADFAALIQHFPEVAFNLTELRARGAELLDDATENLIANLAIDGFHGWGNHYDLLSGAQRFTAPDGTELSAGQAQNRFESSLDAADRQATFTSWEATWTKNAPQFADTLNHLAGFRLANYRAHHFADYMHVPLETTRMSAATLDQMWATVSTNKAPFVAYLQQKARLLGKPVMPWYDQWAPVVVGDFKPKHYSFDEAAAFIIDNFGKFSPKMAEFARHAFEHGWIEAEDRPGKRAGGYMTSVPDVGEARIFMTFDGSASGVSTIAHELGHAFHNSVIKDLPAMRRDYAMNVAETASTFAELIVATATVNAATSIPEKLNLLDAKMSNPLAMLLNIHARYLFERKFYDARQKGTVTVPQLQDMMVAAQQTAYAGSLSSFDPMYWADKLHFFKTGVAFYNYPYTFGYLFSSGIYAKAQAGGGDFEAQYIALLRDTANMSTEDLAQKHLGVNLTQPAFWQQGIDLAAADAQTFITESQAYL